MHGSPEDVLKDPFADTRAMDFVSDPAMRRSRFAGVAEDPMAAAGTCCCPSSGACSMRAQGLP